LVIADAHVLKIPNKLNSETTCALDAQWDDSKGKIAVRVGWKGTSQK
jgi:hypothetical protein